MHRDFSALTVALLVALLVIASLTLYTIRSHTLEADMQKTHTLSTPVETPTGPTTVTTTGPSEGLIAEHLRMIEEAKAGE